MADEQSIKDEYDLWRQNCRYMYEFVNETALTWPSLTVQWLPEHTQEDDVINAKLLLGTHTSGEDTNYLKVATTTLPINNLKKQNRLKITKKIKNEFEINRARYLPQDSNIVATINGGGHIDLYNLDNDAVVEHFQPHTENGYGLSWSPHKKGLLLTASDDQTVALTDIADVSKQVFVNTSHGDIVNDTKWHAFDENLFGSVSDDGYIHLFDVRTPEKPTSLFHSPESKGVNTLAFSPFSQNLLAIGSTNSNISLLDIRKLGTSPASTLGLLHTMMGHLDSITSLEFSPFKDGVVASGSQDRRLIIWDLFKIGEEQAQEDAEDGCPELFMMHAGHQGAVTDFSWCPYKDWTLATVSDDNIIHIWEMSKGLLEEPKLDLKDGDLE